MPNGSCYVKASEASIASHLHRMSHHVTTESPSSLWAAQAKVVLPQAMCRSFHPLSSMYILGYIWELPEVFSLPHAHSWSPTMQAKEEVEPQATCDSSTLTQSLTGNGKGVPSCSGK